MHSPALLSTDFHVSIHGTELFVRNLTHARESQGTLPEAGPSDGTGNPVLVFLHEALGSVGQWKHFPRELCLATGCDGIVYDRKGHGGSSPMDRPRDMNFYHEEAEEILPALLDHLSIQQPVLIGHSDGATIALQYALSFPDRVSAVVSEAAHVLIEKETVDGIRKAREIYATTDLREKLSRYHGEKTDALFSAWADTWLQPEYADWSMEKDLAAIRCPLLVIQGLDDDFGSPAQVESIARNASGDVRTLLLPGCGHVPHNQMRGFVIDSIREFLENIHAIEKGRAIV